MKNLIEIQFEGPVYLAVIFIATALMLAGISPGEFLMCTGSELRQ